MSKDIVTLSSSFCLYNRQNHIEIHDIGPGSEHSCRCRFAKTGQMNYVRGKILIRLSNGCYFDVENQTVVHDSGHGSEYSCICINILDEYLNVYS